MKILVTGAAGFIGFHTAEALLDAGHTVVGLDCFVPYYDLRLKHARNEQLLKHGAYTFFNIDLSSTQDVAKFFAVHDFDCVVHLAAQPGVRYSIENPQAYLTNNIQAFLNIVEALKSLAKPPKLVYASSSSVYGSNEKLPYSEEDKVASPNSFYAASKIANEVTAQTYSHLYGLNIIGLRFFTVYGPWGRPDMAPYIFTKAILESRPIQLFNNGDLMRDFTYIDDITVGVLGAINHSVTGHEIFNLGNNNPTKLLDFVQTLEEVTGITAQKELKPMQPGDVYATYADIAKAKSALGFEPKTNLTNSLKEFVLWYKTFAK